MFQPSRKIRPHLTAVQIGLIVLLGAAMASSCVQGFGGSSALTEASHSRGVDLRAIAGGHIDVALEDALAEASHDAQMEAIALLEAEAAGAALVDARLHAARSTAEHVVPFFYWTEEISEERTWQVIASEFGHYRSSLEELNPGIDFDNLEPGDSIFVYRYDPENPSISRGSPQRGRLRQGMPMPDGDVWNVDEYREAWGTELTVASLIRGFSHVEDTIPGAPEICVFDISTRRGGRNSPHISHQSGRDVDFSYYIHGEPLIAEEFVRVPRRTFDIKRQWELFRYWIDRKLVDYLFVDSRLQRYMYRYLRDQGIEDVAYLDAVFEHGGVARRPIIRHERGHRDHVHVRFRCRDDDRRCRQ